MKKYKLSISKSRDPCPPPPESALRSVITITTSWYSLAGSLTLHHVTIIALVSQFRVPD